MLFWTLRAATALILAYGVSRLVWRVPLSLAGFARVAAVHLASLAVLGTVLELAYVDGPDWRRLVVAQLVWAALDLARDRGGRTAVMARAS